MGVGDFDAQVNQTVSFERAAQDGFPRSLPFEKFHHNEQPDGAMPRPESSVLLQRL